jgi:4,5-dihydroxyphthalate decarboxylase
MAQPKLTIALSHYDRHVPFFDGTVQLKGIHLDVLIVGQSDRQRDGEERHERMLQKGEFDVAELSLSSYLMAKSRGMPFTAIPVFPRPLFSHSQMWINVDAGINEAFFQPFLVNPCPFPTHALGGLTDKAFQRLELIE